MYSVMYSISCTPCDFCKCPHSSAAASESSRVGLSFSGDQFSQEQVNRRILPLLVEFQTQFPNGLLLYTHSSNTDVSRSERRLL